MDLMSYIGYRRFHICSRYCLRYNDFHMFRIYCILNHCYILNKSDNQEKFHD